MQRMRNEMNRRTPITVPAIAPPESLFGFTDPGPLAELDTLASAADSSHRPFPDDLRYAQLGM